MANKPLSPRLPISPQNVVANLTYVYILIYKWSLVSVSITKEMKRERKQLSKSHQGRKLCFNDSSTGSGQTI